MRMRERSPRFRRSSTAAAASGRSGSGEPSAGTSVMTRSSPSVCPTGDRVGSVRTTSGYQMPEKSTLPSGNRDAGASRSGVPSGIRGTLASLTLIHCACNPAVTSNITAPIKNDRRRILPPRLSSSGMSRGAIRRGGDR